MRTSNGKLAALKRRCVSAYLALSVSVALACVLIGVLEVMARFHEPPSRSLLDWKTFEVADRPHSEAYRGVDVTRQCDGTTEFSFDREFVAGRPGDAQADKSAGQVWARSLFRPFIMHYFPGRVGGGDLGTPAVLPHATFVFGGSTVGGDGIRCNDDLLTARLHDEIPDRDFVNLGVSGHNDNNSSAFYVEVLKSGYRPGEVIFYEGSNEATHRVAFGVPTMGYENFVMATMSRSWAFRIVNNLARYSALVRLLMSNDPRQQHIYQSKAGHPALATSLADLVNDERLRARAQETAERIVETHRFLADVSRVAGITIKFVLQPTLFTTHPLSEEEQGILRGVDTYAPHIHKAHDYLYAALRSLMKERLPPSQFIDASDCLDGKSRSVFVDFVHLSPPGNAIIAKCVAKRLSTGHS